mmetsp:Transcript_10963/g.15448  ORF Transcript_10963/g.15448 Transcript_10963/m.15448 type:complete len:831 (+) Transcript_10963:293-2785(+)
MRKDFAWFATVIALLALCSSKCVVSLGVVSPLLFSLSGLAEFSDSVDGDTKLSSAGTTIRRNTTDLLDDTNEETNQHSGSDSSVVAKLKNKLSKGKLQLKETLSTLKKNRAAAVSSKKNKRASASDKLKFLDRIALVSAAMLKSEHDAHLEQDISSHPPNDEITPQSDLTLPGRHFSIVTTAALPWMTGTAVNPLLRAAYLVQKAKEINKNKANDENEQQTKQWVTLVIPWLEMEEDRIELYGTNHNFQNQNEQEEYIRDWLRHSANLVEEADPHTGLKILFYPARYHSGLKSIFGMGDICSLIPDGEADVCILEEPEHLNWYRAPGEGWTHKFNYVVGIVHTNYKEYASAHYSGLWTSPAIAAMSSAMVRAYCHKVIKLSDVLQTFAPEKESTSNVHGVRSEFLLEGQRRGAELTQKTGGKQRHTPTTMDNGIDDEDNKASSVYFIGKILWAKGLDLLLDLQNYYRQCTGEYFGIDVYGSGPDQKEIARAYHGRKLYQSQNGGDNEMKQDDADNNDSSTIRVLGTSIVDPFTDRSGIATKNDDGNLSSSGNNLERAFDFKAKLDTLDTQQALEYLQSKALEKLEKIKTTLEFDVPKSLHEYRKTAIPATFPGRIDHAQLKDQYKVFVNPSVTEVLCTTTAEALAMGKFVIIPVHPSNTFFLRFPNCLAYRNKFEFVANLRWALSHEPEPLTPELAYEFTWEAATERFLNASSITWREARERERLGRSKLDERIAWLHYELGKGSKGDALRKVLGAGPVSNQFKYQIERDTAELYVETTAGDHDSDGKDEAGSEDEGEGLPRKFQMSSLAKAIRTTVANGLPSMLPGFET